MRWPINRHQARTWTMRLAGGLRFPQMSEGERAVRVGNRWKSLWWSGKRGVIPGRRIAATDRGSGPFVSETEGCVTWAFPFRPIPNSSPADQRVFERRTQSWSRMPRACLVEVHASSYHRHGLEAGCHELVSWRFTFRATEAGNVNLHETSSWHRGEPHRPK